MLELNQFVNLDPIDMCLTLLKVERDNSRRRLNKLEMGTVPFSSNCVVM